MNALLNRVVKAIALATRYPEQLLVPDADLENDLGIDSVKRVEIVTALADEFSLDLLSQERDPSIRTIQHIANWIENQFGSADGAHGNSEAPAAASTMEPPSAPPVAPRSMPPAAPIQQPSNNTPMQQPSNDPPTNGAHPNDFQRIDRSNGASRNGGVVQSNFGRQRRSFTGNGSSNSTPQRAAPQVHRDPMSARRNLEGKVALITGSGRGVGRTIARLLASRGATVIINSFHSRDLGEATASEINAASHSAIHLWGSVANPEHVDLIFNEIEREFGFLDMLICNASDGSLGPFSDVTLSEWDCAFHTNVTGHYQSAMRAVPLMQRRGGGSIITMSSIAAQRYVQGLGAQGVIKAAVEAMTRNLACELAEFGIRANCVSGGPVYGDVMSQYPETRSTFNYWESIVPDRQLCSPTDLANAVAFLVSDEAQGVNGAVWTVDHGASTRSHSRPLPSVQNNGVTSNG